MLSLCFGAVLLLAVAGTHNRGKVKESVHSLRVRLSKKDKPAFLATCFHSGAFLGDPLTALLSTLAFGAATSAFLRSSFISRRPPQCEQHEAAVGLPEVPHGLLYGFCTSYVSVSVSRDLRMLSLRSWLYQWPAEPHCSRSERGIKAIVQDRTR